MQWLAARLLLLSTARGEVDLACAVNLLCLFLSEGSTDVLLADLSRKHEIVDFGEGKKFVIVELTGEMDSVEFWEQAQAQQDFEKGLLSSLAGQGEKRSSAVRSRVRGDEVHIRAESPYGLYETTTVRVVVVDVEA